MKVNTTFVVFLCKITGYLVFVFELECWIALNATYHKSIPDREDSTGKFMEPFIKNTKIRNGITTAALQCHSKKVPFFQETCIIKEAASS